MLNKTTTIVLGVAALLLFSIHAHADYLMQAYQHGWWSWLDLSDRAAAVPWYLDLIARDLWHGVQSVRNQSVIAATICAFTAAIGLTPRKVRPWLELVISIAAPFIAYGVTRAVFFSLAKELLN